MAIVYGVSGAFSKSSSKNYERLFVQDNQGTVTTIVSKFARTEIATETVGTTWGAGTIGSLPVLSATITATADQAIIESGSAATAPQIVRFYNPRVESSAQVLGAFTGSSYSLDGITFQTVSAETVETAGDVVKTNIRGTNVGASSVGGTALDLGTVASGDVVGVERRYSNTDYVRDTVTTVTFAGS
jgi:hypothetical protein